MANGLPKRVVFRKPKLDNSKLINLKPLTEQSINLKPDKKTKPIDKPKINSQQTEEPTLEIPDKDQQEIIYTKSKRSIIIKKEPVHSNSTLENTIPQQKTFDEKFLDKINIKSRITKDEKTLQKITKPEIKPTIKPKTSKVKRKFNPYIFISLIACVLLIIWLYKIIKDYLIDKLDGSLASFMYIITNIMLVIITFIWFIIELLMEDKNEKK